MFTISTLVHFHIEDNDEHEGQCGHSGKYYVLDTVLLLLHFPHRENHTKEASLFHATKISKAESENL